MLDEGLAEEVLPVHGDVAPRLAQVLTRSTSSNFKRATPMSCRTSPNVRAGAAYTSRAWMQVSPGRSGCVSLPL
jgi:hypothetical protein